MYSISRLYLFHENGTYVAATNDERRVQNKTGHLYRIPIAVLVCQSRRNLDMHIKYLGTLRLKMGKGRSSTSDIRDESVSDTFKMLRYHRTVCYQPLGSTLYKRH